MTMPFANLQPVSVGDLLQSGLTFHVAAYQRGYRWTGEQVRQLIHDVQHFIQNYGRLNQNSWYCLQPLAVFSRPDGSYEVADGQQRLTTMLIIVEVLRQKLINPTGAVYTIKYETRQGSNLWLPRLHDDAEREKMKDENSDYCQLADAYEAAWTEYDSMTPYELTFHQMILLGQVKFIWYEPQKQATDVFNDLNAGRLSLNNAELIKALFMQAENFKKGQGDLRRKQIAIEWDKIESELHGPLYAFAHPACMQEYDTRIEYLFSLIKDCKPTENNPWSIFNAYYTDYLNTPADKTSWVEAQWRKLKETLDMLREWYTDRTMYHLIGFLLHEGKAVREIQQTVQNQKKEEIRKRLTAQIQDLMPRLGKDDTVADRLLRLEKGKHDATLRRVLLLFNILRSEGARQCFDFDAYYETEKTMGWQLEHVDSNTTFEPDASQKSRDALIQEVMTHCDDTDVCTVLKAAKGSKDEAVIRKASDEATRYFYQDVPEAKRLDQEEKQLLWNFVLLNAATNQSYGNALFSMKRRRILRDDNGGTYTPIGTRQVFEKAYTEVAQHMMAWTRTDAQAYLKEITDTLTPFIK